MRQTSLTIAVALIALASCVTSAETPQTAGPLVTVSGKGKTFHIPNTLPSPGFSALNVDVVGVEAVVDPSADISVQGPSSLAHFPLVNASPQCEDSGCAWNAERVPLNQAGQGLMSVLSDARANPVWQTTYASIVNPNQVADDRALVAPIGAFAPGYVLPQASVQNLAVLLGQDANGLVARGVCLGLVWSTRGEGTGIGQGYAGARITVTQSTGAVPSVYYVNDTMTALSTTGTNVDGLFVLVGPELGTAAPSSFAVPLSVDNAISAGTFVDARAIVRPGVVAVVPIIPRR